jgi:hypothetical protein
VRGVFAVRADLTAKRLDEFLRELSRTAPREGTFRVFLVGGATAVMEGWRESTIDVDIHADDEAVLRDVQRIKERLNVNVELARPEHFVPPLRGSDSRHVFVTTIGRVSYFHYDPYAQVFAKLVRGYERDLDDARSFVRAGLVDLAELQSLVRGIPNAAFAKYPSLSRTAVIAAVDAFRS